jgi:hypothetical protein
MMTEKETDEYIIKNKGCGGNINCFYGGINGGCKIKSGNIFEYVSNKLEKQKVEKLKLERMKEILQ